jgi:hypothetical protein
MQKEKLMTNEEVTRRFKQFAVVVVMTAVVGWVLKLILYWSMKHWLGSDGFASTIASGIGFFVGFMGLCAADLFLCRLLQKTYETAKATTSLVGKKNMIMLSLPILPIAFYFSVSICGVVDFAKACWWSGILDTLMSFIAFFLGATTGLITIMASVALPIGCIAEYVKARKKSEI